MGALRPEGEAQGQRETASQVDVHRARALGVRGLDRPWFGVAACLVAAALEPVLREMRASMQLALLTRQVVEASQLLTSQLLLQQQQQQQQQQAAGGGAAGAQAPGAGPMVGVSRQSSGGGGAGGGGGGGADVAALEHEYCGVMRPLQVGSPAPRVLSCCCICLDALAGPEPSHRAYQMSRSLTPHAVCVHSLACANAAHRCKR